MKRFITPQCLPLLASLVAFLTAGCGSTRYERFPTQRADHYKYSKSQDGLILAIHPVFDRQESQKYFGTDLISANVLAVLVVAENRGTASSFILSKENCVLTGLTQGSGTNAVGSQVGDPNAGKALGIAGGILVSPLLTLLGGNLTVNASVIRQNFETQELVTQTVSPQRSERGFVYFGLPKDLKPPERCGVRVELPEVPGSAKRVFEFTFPWDRKN